MGGSHPWHYAAGFFMFVVSCIAWTVIARATERYLDNKQMLV